MEIIDSNEEGLSLEDQVSEMLNDYFISNEMPSDLDALSTQTAVKEVIVDSVIRKELFNANRIVVEGTGSIDVELQNGSNSDVRRGDGNVLSINFPLKFTLFLIAENMTGKPEDEHYILDNLEYSVDTSSYYN